MNLRDLIERGLKLRAELFWVIVGQFLGFVGSFIGIKVLTTVMGPKGYGELALGLTIAGLFNMYLYGPLANVVARFFAVYRERGELPVYFGVLKKTHTVLALLLCTLAGIVALVVWPWLGAEWALIALVAILYSVVSGINSSYISLQSAMRQRQVVALHQGADVWLRTGLSILFVYVAGSSGYLALLGYAVGTFLITLSQSIFAKRSPELVSYWQVESDNAELIRSSRQEFTKYATSFMFFSGFAAISMYSDRWIVQTLYSLKDVGVYAAISQIAIAPANLLYAMISQLMVPIIFENAGTMTTLQQERKSRQLVLYTCMILGSLSLVMVGVAIVFHKLIVSLLTASTFSQHSHILWIILASNSLLNIGQILSMKGLYFNRPNIYLVPKILQSVACVLFACVLGKQFGLAGVAWGGGIASMFYLLLVIYYNSKLFVGREAL